MAITSFNRREMGEAIRCFETIRRNALLGIKPLEDLFIVSDTIQTATQSSTTLVPTTEFVFPDLAPGTYRFTGFLALNIANAAHNIKLDFAGGTAVASSVRGRAFFVVTAAAGLEVPITALNTAISGATSTAWTSLNVWMTATISSPGSVVLQIAQAASGASNSSIEIGSPMECKRLR